MSTIDITVQNNTSNPEYRAAEPDVESVISIEKKFIHEAEEPNRRRFIQKVLAIVTFQLIVSLSGIFIFQIKEVKSFMLSDVTNLWFFGVAAIFSMGSICIISCCSGRARTYPWNIGLLIVFTLSEAVILGFACINVNINAIYVACSITSAICMALTMFALQTKYDFTGRGPYLLVALLLLMGFTIGLSLNPTLASSFSTWYAIFGIALFSVFLVMDIQKMVGGKHLQHQFEEHEYVFCALSIYLDIINLFLYVLNASNGNRN